MARVLPFTTRRTFPLCRLCDKPVEPADAKTGEYYGKAIHEECYALLIRAKQPKAPTKG